MIFGTNSSDSLVSEDFQGFTHIYTPSYKNSLKKTNEKFEHD